MSSEDLEKAKKYETKKECLRSAVDRKKEIQNKKIQSNKIKKIKQR